MENSRFPVSRILSIISYIIVAILVWLIARLGIPGPASDSIPADARACASVDGGSWNCVTDAGLEIRFSNVPADVTPMLVPIKPEEETRLRAATREGFSCLISILGNVAFERDSKLVSKFDQPVTLTYTFTEEDVRRAADTSLSNCDRPYTPEEFVPVIILSPFKEDSFWMPFPSFSVDGNQAVVQFRVWGDPPIGWGSPKAQ